MVKFSDQDELYWLVIIFVVRSFLGDGSLDRRMWHKCLHGVCLGLAFEPDAHLISLIIAEENAWTSEHVANQSFVGHPGEPKVALEANECHVLGLVHRTDANFARLVDV